MKRITGPILGFVLAVALGTALAQVIHRPRNPQTGLSPGLTYFMAGSEPTDGPDGEIAVRFNRNAPPEFVIFSVADSAWRPVITGSASAEVDLSAKAQGKFRASLDNVYTFQDNAGANFFQIRTPALTTPTTGMLRTFVAVAPGSSHFMADGRFGVLDGADSSAFFRVDDFTDDAHTGTGNIIAALHAETITSPDTNAIHTLLNQDAGWDALALVNAGGVWASADNPPVNKVAFYIDEATNRGGAAAVDCALVARLQSGVEVVIATLVVDAACP